MLRREEKKPSPEQLLDLVQEVLLAIQDNNQNMKDCATLLRAIQRNLQPEKSRWERIKNVFR